MNRIFGHRKCHSEVEVLPAKLEGVKQPMLLITDKNGNILAARAIDADLTINGTLAINGTLTADKIVGAVYE